MSSNSFKASSVESALPQRAVLLLTNEEVAAALSMSECITALDALYREIAQGRALSRHRSDVVVPTSNDSALYALKSMDGVSAGAGMGAVRINSDVLLWPEEAGFTRRTKVPSAPGRRWVGLVLLFDVDTGAPVAILPDGVLQKMRVAWNGRRSWP